MFRYANHGLIFFLLALSCGPLSAEQGDDSVFFQHYAPHAYNAVFGLPAAPPRLVQTLEWMISLEHANQFAGGRVDDETLLLDGEMSRLAIHHRQRLAACWQFEGTLPLIAHSPGSFDRAIDDWHKMFGLPDANRDGSEFNALNYQYTDERGTLHDIQSAQSGAGDIRMAVQRALGCNATADSTRADAMVRLGIKLPTGNANELRGSGETDLFADWQSGLRRWNTRWLAAATVGVLRNGLTERFAEQRQWVLYGSVGTQFAVSHRIRLLAQLDGHSPMFRSELRELGASALSITLGARWLLSNDRSLEVSFSEDAAIDTTPDIAVRLALSYRPQGAR